MSTEKEDPPEVAEREVLGRFSIEDHNKWLLMHPKPGHIVEVVLKNVLEAGDKHIAYYFITEVKMQPDSSFCLRVESLGSKDTAVSRKLTLDHKKKPFIHICAAHSCQEGEYLHHLTELGLISAEGLSPSCLGSSGIKKWIRLTKDFLGVDMEEILTRARRMGRGEADKTDHKRPEGREKKKDMRKESSEDSNGLGDEAEPSKKPAAAGQDFLKQRLKELKESHMRTLTGQPREKEAHLGGTAPKAIACAPEASMVLADKAQEELREMLKADKAKRKALPREEKGGLGSRLLAQTAKALVEQKEEKKMSRKRKGRKEKRALQMLRQVLSGHRDKAKKKRKRKRKDSDSVESQDSSSRKSGRSSGGSDRSTACDSGSSGGSNDPERKFKAPLKRRSEKSPGSVTSLLIKRVEEQMAQLNPVSASAATSVLEGTKLVTYFNLILRSRYRPVVREMRELYLMSNVIDLVRSGNVVKALDLLAARFFALEQARQDIWRLLSRRKRRSPLPQLP